MLYAVFSQIQNKINNKMQEQILGMDKEMFSWMMTLIIIPLFILIMIPIKLLTDYFHNKKNNKNVKK